MKADMRVPFPPANLAPQNLTPCARLRPDPVDLLLLFPVLATPTRTRAMLLASDADLGQFTLLGH